MKHLYVQNELVAGLLVLLVIVLALAFTTPASAQESENLPGIHLTFSNQLWAWYNISTTTKPNPYNNNGHSCSSHDTPGCGLATDGTILNSMLYRYDGAISFHLDSSLVHKFYLSSISGFVHPRIWTDVAPFIDSNLPRINEFGSNQRYAGNGWNATVAEHEWMAQVSEAYIDLRKGRWWLRLGKQQIVYGRLLGVQVLDQVDSIDFRSYSLFADPNFEFSDARIGEWTARLSYALHDMPSLGLSNSTITAWISPDFQPDTFLPAGSPYNTSFMASQVYVNTGAIARARRKLVWGAVLSTTWHNLELSLNYYSTPEHVGWFTAAHYPLFVPIMTPGGPVLIPNPKEFPRDNFRGAPLYPGGPLQDTLLARHFSRYSVYGGSMSYSMPDFIDFLPGGANGSIAGALEADIIQFSAAYMPNMAFQGAQTLLTGKPTRSGDLDLALNIEKFARWSINYPSMFITASVNYRSRDGLFNQYEPAYNHTAYWSTVQTFSQQNSDATVTGFVDAIEWENGGGALTLIPGVTYQPNGNWEFDMWYTYSSGTYGLHPGSGDPLFGAAKFTDQVSLRAVYNF